MRLNGWQRIGVVLAVVWVPVGFFWGNAIGLHQGDWVTDAYKTCLRTHDDWNPCQATFDAQWGPAIANHWWYGAVMVFLPIPLLLLGWAIVRGLVKIGRWVRAGFAPPAS